MIAGPLVVYRFSTSKALLSENGGALNPRGEAFRGSRKASTNLQAASSLFLFLSHLKKLRGAAGIRIFHS
jgi:hypothetical protein